MTHDELLERIVYGDSQKFKWRNALRAVVELCRDYETQYIGGEYGPEYEWGGMEALDKVIQAIEKELG
jgi:hypothetical protein